MSAPARPSLRVAVGSGNPVKVQAVRSAFVLQFPDHDIVTLEYAVASGVPDQPVGETETRRGARNRAQAALEASRAHDGVEPAAASTLEDVDFAVGLEGGISFSASEAGDAEDAADLPAMGMVCFAWMAVLKVADGRWGFGRTGSFQLPPKVAELVEGGMELGDADDVVFGESGSKRKQGAVGLLTGGSIDRTSYYVHALVLALVPFHTSSHLWDGSGVERSPSA
eukprot:PLAT3648.3.p1 GENE.PLAT3648.3~~PLAT3648.3.p1  ORF type:complete len:225 (-),score=92.62 PLAT3648.3:162-836(-)